MKSITKINVTLFLFFCTFFQIKITAESQNSFSIQPSPIPYPYFDPNRYDARGEINLVSITADQLSLSGIFADVKGRYAFSNFFAFDGFLGLNGLSGTMPGIPPLSLSISSNKITPYIYRVDGKGQVSMYGMSMGTNLEIQALHTNSFGLILFAGPNFSFNNMTITTPYSLIVPFGYSNVGQAYTGYTSTLTILSTTTGGLFGAQADINMGHDIRLSPFFMASTTSGSSTLTSVPG